MLLSDSCSSSVLFVDVMLFHPLPDAVGMIVSLFVATGSSGARTLLHVTIKTTKADHSATQHSRWIVRLFPLTQGASPLRRAVSCNSTAHTVQECLCHLCALLLSLSDAVRVLC